LILVFRRPTRRATLPVFEAYLGGHWYTFDARNNIPRIGRVLMAQGRDAADVPITQTFGPNTLVSFKVWADELL
jgi:transglutaminase-like putative cysteine protease